MENELCHVYVFAVTVKLLFIKMIHNLLHFYCIHLNKNVLHDLQ